MFHLSSVDVRPPCHSWWKEKSPLKFTYRNSTSHFNLRKHFVDEDLQEKSEGNTVSMYSQFDRLVKVHTNGILNHSLNKALSVTLYTVVGRDF